MTASTAPLGRLCRWTASITLIDALLGMVFPLAATLMAQAPLWSRLAASMRPFSLFGAAAALAVLLIPRVRRAGMLAILVFYALQVICYYSGSVAFSFRSGISVTWTIALQRGALLVNVAALAGLVLTAWALAHPPRPQPPDRLTEENRRGD